MKKLKDITYRHELIERYLDADTSVEEEQALADFYRHCENKDLTDEDLDIRNLMLGMENYTPNILQPASKKHETRWVRLSAILLATAMLATSSPPQNLTRSIRRCASRCRSIWTE